MTAEKLFKKKMLEEGRIVTDSNRKQNMFGHIDYFVDGEGYDVKGEKRFDRQNDDDDSTIWIESINVRGEKGWLFGEAKYIAFLIKNEFWILPRSKLVEYIEKEITCPTLFPIKRYKKWYRRRGLLDAVTYVYPRDIESLVTRKMKI